ncbi:molybdenum cofactor guanylyltransferase MobA [Afipia sp. P52-10]|uniref:molybdenum cofactor guanylyltransferase MobA n=1 Tax=Afipia sp. P52-10 TaxID=1429916 RepID=UPI0004AEC47C|nr:molybdenum cofactor guanylyltransferase MobA [Afipia sp. P52-10]
MDAAQSKVFGIILAGGRAERLGGRGKADLSIGDETLVARAIRRLRPQCAGLVLNSNEPAQHPALPIAPDPVAERLGPLSGVLAGLDWIAVHAPDVALAVTVPVDGPFLPANLVARLSQARDDARAEIACAASNGRRHGVYALWPVSLRSALRDALLTQHLRKVDHFLARYQIAVSPWDTTPADPFFNINTPADLDHARALIVQFPDF